MLYLWVKSKPTWNARIDRITISRIPKDAREAYNWPGWLNWLWSEYRTLSQKNPKTNEDNRRMDVIRTSFSEKSGGIEIEDIIKREDIITGLRENAITDNNPKLASDLRKLWDQILFFKNEDIFYSTLYLLVIEPEHRTISEELEISYLHDL